jgi:hypothetical protein
MQTTEAKLELLWKDYQLNSNRHSAVWQSFSQTFVIAIKGILAVTAIGSNRLMAVPRMSTQKTKRK